MCGVAGIINHRNNDASAEIIRRMTGAIAHRGPDGDGFYTDPDVCLGHRRLSIIDLAGGWQPIYNEDKTVVVILNGEIYNYLKLRKILTDLGHKFATNSDTEVLVHAYEEYGSEFVDKLDGMFAFALYDTVNRKFFMARDRMGKKPMVYFVNYGELVFASEFEALKAHPSMPKKLNTAAISDFMSFQYIPGPDTIYANVYKLPPGHLLEMHLDDSLISIHRYWQLDFSLKTDLNFDEATEKLRSLVERAVKKRLMSDVPFGVFLSGGVDSAIISALMCKLRMPEKTMAFTIGFDDPAYDERNYARQTAAFINQKFGKTLDYYEKVVSPDDFANVVTLVRHYGEPYADASMLPTYLLSQFASEKITMALSGDGADEVFGGYERYLAIRMGQRLDMLSAGMHRGLFELAGKMIKDDNERTFAGRLRRSLLVWGASRGERYFKILNRCPEEMRQSLFTDQLRIQSHDAKRIFEDLEWELTSPDLAERCSELDTQTYLPNDILVKMDIASMAASIEVRSPFLDKDVVEFAASLPFSYKLHGSSRKHILKKAFEEYLPEGLFHRRKRGFGVPIGRFMRENWRRPVEELLFDNPQMSEYFKRAKMRELWDDHQSGRSDNTYILWNLTILSLFLKN